jgi:hypothetical protein
MDAIKTMTTRRKSLDMQNKIGSKEPMAEMIAIFGTDN